MDKACPCKDSLQDSAAPLKLRTVRKEYLQKKADSKTSFYTHYVAYIFSQYSLIFDGAPSVFSVHCDILCRPNMVSLFTIHLLNYYIVKTAVFMPKQLFSLLYETFHFT